LRFAAGQGSGRSSERQIIQADVDQKLQSLADFLENRPRDFFFPRRQLQVVDPLEQMQNAFFGELVDVDAADADGQSFLGQALPAAFFARDIVHHRFHPVANEFRRRFDIPAFQTLDDAFKRFLLVMNHIAGFGLEFKLQNLVGAVQNLVLICRHQILKRFVNIDAETFGGLNHLL